MAIERKSQITELYEFRHFHDDNAGHEGFDYENNLLPNMMSDVIYRNDTTRGFLNELQKLHVWMLESTLVVRNFFNYTVGRYHNKYSN
jgi:hypothetical protein